VAFGLLVDTCDTDVSAACSSVARVIAEGRAPKEAVASALQKIRSSCENGKAVWCRRLGFWYEQGLTVAKDEPSARSYYLRACEGGDLRGCADAGRMLWAGQGGTKEPDQALVILEKGCADSEAGAGACSHLGMILVNRAQGGDHKRGASLLERACDRGDGLACDRLGGFFSLGTKGFPKDERHAADRFERACALAGRACDEARRLREKIGFDGPDDSLDSHGTVVMPKLHGPEPILGAGPR
jgi:hypothetical protein